MKKVFVILSVLVVVLLVMFLILPQSQNYIQAAQPDTAAKNGNFTRIELKPIDEGSKNPDFKVFRDKLLMVIEQKDVAFLKKHVAPDIKDNSENRTIDWIRFSKEWNLNQNPSTSNVWNVLRKVLLLGGRFDKEGVFTAPYTFTDFSASVYEFEAVIDQNVKIYEKPLLTSKVLGTISYEIVKYGNFLKEQNLKNWTPIVTSSGIKGYIQSNFLRSPLDYRASFKKINGEWKLTMFQAGL